MPVEDESDRGGGRFFYGLIDQESAVTGDRVLVPVVGCGAAAKDVRLKQSHGSSGFEYRARRRHGRCHQFSVRCDKVSILIATSRFSFESRAR